VNRHHDDRHALRIVHDIPGRLRLRLPVRAGIAGLSEALQSLPGVSNSAWTPRTRSLLVLYQPETITSRTIVQAVADHAGIDESLVAPTTRTEHSPASEGRPTVTAAVRETFGQLDRRVVRATKGMVGLGGFAAVLLAMWAAREIVLGHTEPLRWSTALWYAHGLFRDYGARTS
jgi:hypothetical protein